MTLTSAKPQKETRGVSAVAIVLLLTSSLMLLMAGVSELATQRYRAVTGDTFDTKARYAAYAGAQFALLNLTLNPDYTITGATYGMPGEAGTAFTITVTNNYSSATPVAGPGGISIPAGMCYIQSEGTTLQGGRAFALATATLAYRGDAYFNHAALAQGQVSLDNSFVDAYWSYVEYPAGTWTYYQYGDGSPQAGQPGGPAENGNLGSNSTRNAIVLSNGSEVWGVPVVGPLSTLGDAFVNDGTCTTKPPQVGTSTKRVARYRPPMNPALATTAITVPSGATVTLPPDAAYTDVHVMPGGTLVLQSGVYMFTGNFTVEGDVTMTYAAEPVNTDPATLYLGGNVNVSATGQVNPNGIPQSVRLAAMGSGTPNSRVVLNADGAQMWCLMGGRGLDVNLSNNTHVYGGIVANTVNMTNNSWIHYDRNLYGNGQGGLATWSMLGMVEDEKEDIDFGSGGAAAGPAGGAAVAAAGGPAAAAGPGPAAAGPAAGGGDAVGPGDAGGGDAAGDAAAGDAGAGGDAVGDAVGPAGGPAAAAAAAAAAGPATAGPATAGPATTTGASTTSGGDGDCCGY